MFTVRCATFKNKRNILQTNDIRYLQVCYNNKAPLCEVDNLFGVCLFNNKTLYQYYGYYEQILYNFKVHFYFGDFKLETKCIMNLVYDVVCELHTQCSLIPVSNVYSKMFEVKDIQIDVICTP